MDLWIRSQDRKQLLPAGNCGWYIANGFKDDPKTYLGIKNAGHVGSYDTEQRALEVLDEIQMNIENYDVYETRITDNFFDTYSEAKFKKVYEIPKE